MESLRGGMGVKKTFKPYTLSDIKINKSVSPIIFFNPTLKWKGKLLLEYIQIVKDAITKVKDQATK